MAAYPHHPRETSQPAYTPMLEGRLHPNSPPTPPPTTSTLSPPLHHLHHHTSSGSAGTVGILTPPSSPPKPQQKAQAQPQSHSQPHHKSSDSGVGLSSYPLKYNHVATTHELSKPYPLLSTVPLNPYRGSMSLCDLLDDVLDSMTEFSNPQPPPPPPPPHPGTQVMLSPPMQARPISLLRCTSVPVDDECLARYTRSARAFVRRVEGGIGMWGLNRFMTALRSGSAENEGGDGNLGVCKVNVVCSLLALRDGEDSYGASLAERLTSVKVDVRTLLEEVGAGLRGLGAGIGEDKEVVVVVKKDVGWERNKLQRLAELVEMLLASLIPAIEERVGGRSFYVLAGRSDGVEHEWLGLRME
ncbi:hypothetical protein EV426DRAFT_46508 [Tirmania nivea]|nr:hypothetical protein EV426DRAFT_46508 [Tirmania nivea]